MASIEEKFKINDRILELMNQYQLSESALSRSIGFKPQAINNIKNKKNKPSLDLITSVIEKFPEISIEWLLLGNGNMMKGDASEDALKQKELLNKSIKGKENDIKSETINIEDSGNCESCKKLNNRIEFLEDLLRDRDTEIARLNQEIGRLKPNQEEPKKGKAHYG